MYARLKNPRAKRETTYNRDEGLGECVGPLLTRIPPAVAVFPRRVALSRLSRPLQCTWPLESEN